MKALILAAGLGTRLRPLTNVLPKPLCRFFAKPMLDLVYDQIRKAGIDTIAINTHHLADLIKLHIQANPSAYTRAPTLSYEPNILGTGGAINPLRTWLGHDDLLICNGDIIADINLPGLIAAHQNSQADATMVLLDRHKPGTTPIAFEHDRIKSIGGQPLKASETLQLATFSGIHIVGARLVQAISTAGSPSIIEAYIERLNQGALIGSYIHSGFWEDLGTPLDYFAAHRLVLHHQDRDALCSRLGLDSPIRWDEELGTAFCGTEPFPSKARDSFIFGPIHGDAPIQSCLVYTGVVLQPGHMLKNQIVTRDCSMNIA